MNSPTKSIEAITRYAAHVVSPWKSCAAYTPGASFSCVTAGSTIHNARLDYVVTNLNSGMTSKVTAFPINTRYRSVVPSSVTTPT